MKELQKDRLPVLTNNKNKHNFNAAGIVQKAQNECSRRPRSSLNTANTLEETYDDHVKEICSACGL